MQTPSVDTRAVESILTNDPRYNFLSDLQKRDLLKAAMDLNDRILFVSHVGAAIEPSAALILSLEMARVFGTHSNACDLTSVVVYPDSVSKAGTATYLHPQGPIELLPRLNRLRTFLESIYIFQKSTPAVCAALLFHMDNWITKLRRHLNEADKKTMTTYLLDLQQYFGTSETAACLLEIAKDAADHFPNPEQQQKMVVDGLAAYIHDTITELQRVGYDNTYSLHLSWSLYHRSLFDRNHNLVIVELARLANFKMGITTPTNDWAGYYYRDRDAVRCNDVESYFAFCSEMYFRNPDELNILAPDACKDLQRIYGCTPSAHNPIGLNHFKTLLNWRVFSDSFVLQKSS